MNRGVPPTPRKARTGLLTPPGSTRCAAANSRSDAVVDRAEARTSVIAASSASQAAASLAW